jgi:hypothetical protein
MESSSLSFSVLSFVVQNEDDDEDEQENDAPALGFSKKLLRRVFKKEPESGLSQSAALRQTIFARNFMKNALVANVASAS